MCPGNHAPALPWQVLLAQGPLQEDEGLSAPPCPPWQCVWGHLLSAVPRGPTALLQASPSKLLLQFSLGLALVGEEWLKRWALDITPRPVQDALGSCVSCALHRLLGKGDKWELEFWINWAHGVDLFRVREGTPHWLAVLLSVARKVRKESGKDASWSEA